MTVLFVYTLNFEYYNSRDLAEIDNYFQSRTASEYLVLYSGDMADSFCQYLDRTRCYKLVKVLPDWQIAYLCAFLALRLKKSKVVLCEPIVETKIDLSEFYEEASLLLALLADISEQTLFDEGSLPCVRKIENLVNSIEQDLARAKVRALVNFIKLAQETTCELVGGSRVAIGTSIPNLFDVVKCYRGIKPDFLSVRAIRQEFPEPVRELESFFRFLRMLAQNQLDPPSIDQFPESYVVLVIFFEINAVSTKRSGDSSLYLIYMLRSVDLLLTGRLIDYGHVEFNGIGKLFLSYSGRDLWEAHSRSSEKTPKSVNGLGVIVRLCRLAELICDSLASELEELVRIRNSLRYTHGFTKLGDSDEEHVGKVYLRVKKALLSGRTRDIYDGVGASINSLTYHDVIKSYFDSSIRGGWITQ